MAKGSGGGGRAGRSGRDTEGLTARDRQKLRSLQDRLVNLAERRGISDTTRISGDVPANMTLGNLRRFIFPRYEGAIRSAIQDLERR